MSSKKQRTFELIPEQNFFKRVDEILNQPEIVKNRGGDYMIPFPRMLELDVQENIYKQLLEEKKMTKRNLIALFETAKKAQEKYLNYWNAHATNSENYDFSGKHNPHSVWEHFLNCNEYTSIPNVYGEMEWVLHLGYQIADGKGVSEHKKPRPINRYILEKCLKVKDRGELSEKIVKFEKAIEKITQEIVEVLVQLKEIEKKKVLLIRKEWEEDDKGNLQPGNFPDEIPEIE